MTANRAAAAKDGPLDVLADFAPWLLVVAPLAIVALAAAPLWVIPAIVIGGPAWAIWMVTMPRRARPDSRTWRQAGGSGYAPQRLHPATGSCAGEAE